MGLGRGVTSLDFIEIFFSGPLWLLITAGA